ncbi:Tim10/DDP family zinc finger-domain-containing protein [Suillus clintonianus]|uniref:Tim10/DDP family zinc finger-domain-containing protein n=1 Tax=Suillus clintonianus TaxID=1904413 RepID=UPI001B86AC0A|nr:Tim10/DDP family zinc finger-domain-containing protein [Suillus clintonianus]KAG2145241.1 Tim10/DDP family zinc finger-domain-containing protein [Suillus clintonianus]
MSDFFKSSASSSSPSDMAAKKEAVMNGVRSEIALASAQELINKTNEKCYDKCITKPGTSLSGSEETCLSRCLERYLETFNMISKTYTARLSREREQRQNNQI